MNKEYVYKDGKALIIDENGKQKETDYYDNLDEVLAKENLIENMEKYKKKLEKEINNLKNYKFHKIYFLFSLIGLPLISLLMSYIFPILLIGTNEILKLIAQFVVPLFSLIGITMAYCEYIEYKTALNIQRGKETKLELLKSTIKSSKEDDDFSIKKVEDKKYINNLSVALDFFYDLGYNEKKYYKLYKKGKLGNKLKKYWSEGAVEEANSYFEENGPVLEKKYKKVKN